MIAVAEIIKSLPKNMKIAPTVCTAPNLHMFFITKRKAFQADLQKFLDDNAT